MTNSVYIPPDNAYYTCDNYCHTNPIILPECPTECDAYTFGPFRTPSTLYTYYKYPSKNYIINTNNCAKVCTGNYLQNELVYSIYQIIDSEEHYVGEWVIKNKDTPNKKEFDECGLYILRYCSKPPSECYPECYYPEIPKIYYSKTIRHLHSEIVCVKRINCDDPQFRARLCVDLTCGCAMNKTSLYTLDGVCLDLSLYNIVNCC